VPTPTPSSFTWSGHSLAVHSWITLSIHRRAAAFTYRDAAPRLRQYLAREIDDDGDVGLDLNLDAYHAAESTVHGQVNRTPAPRVPAEPSAISSIMPISMRRAT